MIDFLIFYEIKNREFESIVLLRNELVKRGYTVDYISFYQCNSFKVIKKYNGNVRVALMPSLYHDIEILRFVYLVCGRVTHIVNLRWEQVFYNRNETDRNDYMFPKGHAGKAIHCSWGTEPKKMMHMAGVEEQNLPVVGPMQMDLLSPKFNNYFLSKAELGEKYGLDYRKKWAIFVSSFALASMTDEQVRVFGSEIGDDLKSNVDLDRHAQLTICNWIRDFVQSNSCEFIYRPHPTEYKTKIIEDLCSRESIHCIATENIKQWIKCCDCVYTMVSTSIAEAFYAGRSCAVLRPYPIEHANDISIYNGAEFITQKESFISSFDEDGKIYVNASTLGNYYDVNFEKLSYIRVADVLEKCVKAEIGYFDWKELLTFKNKIKILRFKIRILLENSYLYKFYHDLLSKLLIWNESGHKIPEMLLKKARGYKSSLRDSEAARIISQGEFKEMQDKLESFM